MNIHKLMNIYRKVKASWCSILPMSAEPEHIFSGVRRTISWQRIRLRLINIEQLECLKSSVREGIILGRKREQLVKNKRGVEGLQEAVNFDK